MGNYSGSGCGLAFAIRKPWAQHRWANRSRINLKLHGLHTAAGQRSSAACPLPDHLENFPGNLGNLDSQQMRETIQISEIPCWRLPGPQICLMLSLTPCWRLPGFPPQTGGPGSPVHRIFVEESCFFCFEQSHNKNNRQN